MAIWAGVGLALTSIAGDVMSSQGTQATNVTNANINSAMQRQVQSEAYNSNEAAEMASGLNNSGSKLIRARGLLSL